MATVSENVVGIKIQASGAQASAAEFAKVNAALKATEARAESLRRGMAALGSFAAGAARTGLLALTAATTGAVAALGKGIHSAIEMGDALDELSARTSVSVSSLAVLQQAFTLAGVGADKVGDAVSKMLRNIDAAATSTALQERLAGLGVSLAELAGMNPEQQFQRLGQAIGSIADPAEQTAAAMELFGRGGAELLPLFKSLVPTMAKARLQMGELSGILERNAAGLANMADVADGLGKKLTQLGAGFLDQVLPRLDDFADKVNGLDLTGLGQSIGNWLNTLLDAFANGEAGHFLALNLQVGWESFLKVVRDGFSNSASWVSLGEFTLVLSDAFMDAVDALNGALITTVLAIGSFVYDVLKQAFLAAANFLGQSIVDVLNEEVAAINTLFGTSVKAFTYTAKDTGAASWEKSWTDAAAKVDGLMAKQKAARVKGIEDFRAGYGIGGNTGETAAEELARKLKVTQDKTDATKAATEADRQAKVAADAFADAQRRQAAMIKATNDDLDDQIDELEHIGKAVEYYDEQKRLAAEAEHKRLMGLTYAGQAQQNYDSFKQSQAAEGTLGNGGMGAGALAGAQESLIALGTLAEQTGRAMKTFIGGAVDGIADGLKGLLKGTLTWGQALAKVGGSIMDGVIDAISRMFAEWIVGLLLKSAVTKATAASDAAALAGPAILTSIGSWGLAAAAGAAGFLAAMALTGGFAEGGYTGDMGATQPAGVVHGREFVFSAPVTASLGREDLEALHRGQAEITPRGGRGGSSSGVNIAIMNTRTESADWLRSGEGRGIILDVFRQHRHEFI